MRNTLIFSLLLTIALLGCNQGPKDEHVEKPVVEQLLGNWIRFGQEGITTLEFKKNGLLIIDMLNDGNIDVHGEYRVGGDTIIFEDVKGNTCPEPGKYLMDVRKEYVSFDVLDDMCGGRIKTTTGFWTRPSYPDLIKHLDQQIENGTDPEDYLLRGRIYLAIGQSKNARPDFDSYIQIDTTNYRAYLNRAATCFPHDMEGALADCDKAIALNPDNKNLWFLRGLALYELGRKEEACADFAIAIKLGFDILRIAEQEKCKEFWEEDF